MSNLKIEERITVGAPPARVWAFLLDPARVAACLPGAKLDGSEGDRTFLGTMKVKVGPVAMEFKGKATMTEVDEAERRVVLVGTGNDKSGSGSARMEMKSRIVAVDGGGSEIVVDADVDLAGKIVRFGRGMMEGISKQLFKQFAERVRAELATAESEPTEPPAPAPEPAREAAPEPAKEPEPPPPEEPEPTKEAETPREAAPEPAKETAPQPVTTALAPAEPEALDAGSLVFSAIWEWIKNLFRRIFGRKE